MYLIFYFVFSHVDTILVVIICAIMLSYSTYMYIVPLHIKCYSLQQYNSLNFPYLVVFKYCQYCNIAIIFYFYIVVSHITQHYYFCLQSSLEGNQEKIKKKQCFRLTHIFTISITLFIPPVDLSFLLVSSIQPEELPVAFLIVQVCWQHVFSAFLYLMYVYILSF